MRLPIAAAILLGCAHLPAQTLDGHVLDAESRQPVAGAVVAVEDSTGRVIRSVATSRQGGFHVGLRRGGTVRVRAERAGYAAARSDTVSVAARDTVSVELLLSARAVAVEPLTVVARRGPRRMAALEARGFYDRERRGLGDFLHREDLERGAPMRLSQVLDRVPGTTLIAGRSSDFIIFDRSLGTGIFRRPGDTYCLPKIYLDGVWVSQQSGINLAQPEQVEAVEMYHGASQVPAEYNDSQAACGVILIWTRMSP